MKQLNILVGVALVWCSFLGGQENSRWLPNRAAIEALKRQIENGEWQYSKSAAVILPSEYGSCLVSIERVAPKRNPMVDGPNQHVIPCGLAKDGACPEKESCLKSFIASREKNVATFFIGTYSDGDRHAGKFGDTCRYKGSPNLPWGFGLEIKGKDQFFCTAEVTGCDYPGSTPRVVCPLEKNDQNFRYEDFIMTVNGERRKFRNTIAICPGANECISKSIKIEPAEIKSSNKSSLKNGYELHGRAQMPEALVQSSTGGQSFESLRQGRRVVSH